MKMQILCTLPTDRFCNIGITIKTLPVGQPIQIYGALRHNINLYLCYMGFDPQPGLEVDTEIEPLIDYFKYYDHKTVLRTLLQKSLSEGRQANRGKSHE